MKRVVILLLALALTLSFATLTNQNTFNMSSTVNEMNLCAKDEKTFLECIDKLLPELVKNTPSEKIENLWVNLTIEYQWPYCHDALHLIGHYLPDLSASQLRNSTKAACAFGLMMGFAEKDITNINDEKIIAFNKKYCLPSLDNKTNYSVQCSHVTGHLVHNIYKQDLENAIKLCEKVRFHINECVGGVLMLYYQELGRVNQIPLSSLKALSDCKRFTIYADRCLPYASHNTTINNIDDIIEQSKICLDILENLKEKYTSCAELISQGLGRLSIEKLLSSEEVCLQYPDVNTCTMILINTIATQTKDYSNLELICSSPLKNTQACQERVLHFNQVFPGSGK
ncbi:MAG: hypothetical protein ACKOW9_03065 [Candidatus Paceibacterota bacterium]